MMWLQRRAVAALAVVLVAVLAPAVALAAPFAAVVMDMRTGEILHARNHDTRLHPASLTKMMTLYIAFEAVRNGEITLDTPVRISANAAGQPCSCLGLRAGQTIALRHLIRAAALRSGNDAATAIGEAISGSEAAFIARMNRTAAALGMTNTTFRNAHGLTASGHLSTARDMTILGRQLYFDYPEYWNLWSRRSADAGIAQVANTNRRFLDGYSGADGIKTGFTRAAGFNLTASAERGGKRVIVTVFGGQSVPDRTRRVIELMDLGFDRAPARVAVRRPAPPNYGAQPPAAAMAASSSNDRPAAGRTIRINTAVARSPIPPTRPTADDAPAEAAIAALQDGIDAALAGVDAPAPLAPPRPDDLVTAATDPDREENDVAAQAPLPFDIAEAEVPEQSAAAEAPPAADAIDEPIPFQLAEAAPPNATEPATDAGPEPAEDLGSELAVDAAPLPPARPETLVAALATAEDTPEGEATETAQLTADEASEADEMLGEAASNEPMAAGIALAAAPPAATADSVRNAPEVMLAALPARNATRTERAAPPRPRPAPDPLIVLTYTPTNAATDERLRSAAQAQTGPALPVERTAAVAAAAEEVVLRHVSTSEPRMWSVSLGRYGTRDGAERALMRAALAELASFDGALRRVQRNSGGFEATFVGLTEAQALSACDRLRARDRDCAALAP